MTKHEAALLLERMVDEGKDLTSEAAEALMMGINALNGYNVDEWCLHCKEYDRKTYNCPRFNQTIHKAVEALRNNRWIPCSKRMPNVDEDGYSEKLLVSFSNSALPEIGEYRVLDGKADFWVGDLDEKFTDYGLSVNAWQLLPKSYQPEQEEHAGCTDDACPIEGVQQDE